MSDRGKTVREGLYDLGARNGGTPQGTLELFLLRAQPLILQTFPGDNGCELYAPVTRSLLIEDTLKAADEYGKRSSDPALTYAELSTVLVALRHWQGTSEKFEKPTLGYPQFNDVAPLNDDQINSLCERLNCGEIVTITGGPKGRQMRNIIAEFHKSAGGRLTLFSLVVVEEQLSQNGETYISRSMYDVEFSRQCGYVFHQSGFGGHVDSEEVRGIYWTSGSPKVTELPTQLVDAYDKPPWRSKKTRAIRERNRTRRLRRLPKPFSLASGEDLLGWLERNAIHDESVWCSTCRDWFPRGDLCRHCWWCDKTGDYSTPQNRCECASAVECADSL